MYVPFPFSELITKPIMFCDNSWNEMFQEKIYSLTSFTLRSVRVNISKCLKIILDYRKSGRRAGKHIVPSFLTFQTNTKTKIGMFFLQFDNSYLLLTLQMVKEAHLIQTCVNFIVDIVCSKTSLCEPQQAEITAGNQS